MSLHLSALPGALLRPRATFESIRESTTWTDGLAMGILFAAANVAVYHALPQAVGIGRDGALLPSLQGAFGEIARSLLFLAFAGVVAASVAGVWGGQRDVGRTVGLLGYAGVWAFLLATVPLLFGIGVAGIFPASGGLEFEDAALAADAARALPLMVLGLLALAASLVAFLWVYGTAVAVANRVSPGKGIACFAVAVLLALAVMAPLAQAAGATPLLALNSGPTHPLP